MAWAMKCHLASAVGGYHGDIARCEQVVFVARKALCEYGRVFANPKLIGRVRCACRCEILHRLVGRQVGHKTQVFDHSTTFTKGWEVRVRYNSSSCSRLVAVTLMVTPK